MSKTKTVRVTDAELAALRELRRQAGEQVAGSEEEIKKEEVTESQQALVSALAEAIARTQPPRKHTVATRKPKTAWTPPDGTPRLKMKRKMFHHGMAIGDFVTNDDIELLNRIKPGVYCDGWVRVSLRKDRGLDIDYPIRTASQRLKLTNTYGVRSFNELLKRIVDEGSNPTKYRRPEDSDLYDLES